MVTTGDEWWRPMPPGATADALRVLAARGLRAFGDGFVALLLPIYLVELGFSALAIGAIVTSTLIGTAVLTLWVGWVANRYPRRFLLLAAARLMAATGAGFAVFADFWPLLVIAFVGTMNPPPAMRAFSCRSSRPSLPRRSTHAGEPRSSHATALLDRLPVHSASSLLPFPNS